MSETLQFAFVEAQKEFVAGQLYGTVSLQSVRRQKFLLLCGGQKHNKNFMSINSTVP